MRNADFFNRFTPDSSRSKTFSAYDFNGVKKNPHNRISKVESERDAAIETAKKLMAKKTNAAKPVNKIDELYQKAKLAKKSGAPAEMKPTEMKSAEEAPKEQPKMTPPQRDLTDEEIREQISKAKKLNDSDAVRGLGTDATQEDILNAILNDIF